MDPIAQSSAVHRPRAAHRLVVAAALLAAVVAPGVLDAYTISLATYALVLGLLASSAYVLTNVAGLPTLGQGAYLAIGGYTAAAISHTITTNGPAQLIAGAAAGAAAAAAIGVLAARTRGTTFLIITLAVGALTQTLASRAVPLTGGDAGLAVDPITVLPGASLVTVKGYLYLYALVCTVIIGGALTLMLRSRFGLAVRGIAANEPRARADGYPADTYLWVTYTVAGAVAGAAGAILVATRHTIAPVDGGFVVSGLALLAALLVTRTLVGALLGATVIVAVRDLIAPNVLAGHASALLGGLFLAAAFARILIRPLIHRSEHAPARRSP
ncbi:branched-chain amino acid ABC transporter permease [Dactylosporangium sp. NPDC050688]|uniref:branched-chain amino acid ABC transporter permease n=1 Tax=Dactylosporangium sp. NPDC050688 TaxID=3157217 RepID=UPI0033C686D3